MYDPHHPHRISGTFVLTVNGCSGNSGSAIRNIANRLSLSSCEPEYLTERTMTKLTYVFAALATIAIAAPSIANAEEMGRGAGIEQRGGDHGWRNHRAEMIVVEHHHDHYRYHRHHHHNW
jgi:hypothetical protein